MPTVTALLGLLRAATRDRQRLALENAALRHQVAVLKRSVKRPRLEDSDRLFWIVMRRALRDWKDALFIVKPDTVVRWHRQGFKHYWKRKSKPRTQGRPSIGWKLVHLIRRLSTENVTWGAPRIHDELAMLGHEVAESTIDKYRVRHRDPGKGQRWSTFIRNHMPVTVACDFFVVPTITFKLLYVFVVLSHDRRRIQNVGVTRHPTAEWTARQVVEAFPGDGTEPKYLVRDRDAIYGDVFRRQLEVMGIKEAVTARKSPWQNAYVERVIGSIRRECTDYIIPFGERRLTRVLREYVEYYNKARTHQGLGGDAPEHREREAEPADQIVGVPVLGGLHHQYLRAA